MGAMCSEGGDLGVPSVCSGGKPVCTWSRSQRGCRGAGQGQPSWGQLNFYPGSLGARVQEGEAAVLNEQTKILLKPPFPKQIRRGGGGLNYEGVP